MKTTFPVSDSLGSLFETYLLDGIDGDDEPELFAAHLAVSRMWDRKRNRITVYPSSVEYVAAGVVLALNSLDAEPPAPGAGCAVANIRRSGEAFLQALAPLRKVARGEP
jgi:hypothetical protein